MPLSKEAAKLQITGDIFPDPATNAYTWDSIESNGMSIGAFTNKYRPSKVSATKPYLWVRRTDPGIEIDYASVKKESSEYLKGIVSQFDAISTDSKIPARSSKKTGVRGKKDLRDELAVEAKQMLQEIAEKYSLTSGKWCVFVEPKSIDKLWISITESLISGPLSKTAASAARVSTSADHAGYQHQLSVYLPNIFDQQTATEILKILIRNHGLETATCKADLFVIIGLDSKHPSRIRSTWWQAKELLGEEEGANLDQGNSKAGVQLKQDLKASVSKARGKGKGKGKAKAKTEDTDPFEPDEDVDDRKPSSSNVPKASQKSAVPMADQYTWTPEAGVSIDDFLDQNKPSATVTVEGVPWISIKKQTLPQSPMYKQAIRQARDFIKTIGEQVQAIQNDPDIPVRGSKKQGRKSKKEMRESLIEEAIITLKGIAVGNDLVSGRWMCYVPALAIDGLFKSLSLSLLSGALSKTTTYSVSASTASNSDLTDMLGLDDRSGGDGHVICVHFSNLFNEDEARAVLEVLIRNHGLKRVTAKPDLYTFIALTSKHASKIRPTWWQAKELFSEEAMQTLMGEYNSKTSFSTGSSSSNMKMEPTENDRVIYLDNEKNSFVTISNPVLPALTDPSSIPAAASMTPDSSALVWNPPSLYGTTNSGATTTLSALADSTTPPISAKRLFSDIDAGHDADEDAGLNLHSDTNVKVEHDYQNQAAVDLDSGPRATKKAKVSTSKKMARTRQSGSKGKNVSAMKEEDGVNLEAENDSTAIDEDIQKEPLSKRRVSRLRAQAVSPIKGPSTRSLTKAKAGVM